ncbi:MAG: YkgJ family cysteine cluster protein [Candidatus Bathyarchaeota archaeon]|nr:YkgJ family cysteine cluster protein [Candidatus Bathyarchaeum sp.]
MFEYPKDVGFVCNGCAQCCGDTEDTVRCILLLKTDAERISNKTLLDINEFAEQVSGCEPYIYKMKKPEDGKCFFLENNRCTIYEIRPLICRFYPFKLDNLGNNRYIFSYTNKCEGIGKGPHHKKVFFENLFNEATNAIDESTTTH